MFLRLVHPLAGIQFLNPKPSFRLGQGQLLFKIDGALGRRCRIETPPQDAVDDPGSGYDLGVPGEGGPIVLQGLCVTAGAVMDDAAVGERSGQGTISGRLSQHLYQAIE